MSINDRLRHTRIGYARVSKADGSQVVAYAGREVVGDVADVDALSLQRVALQVQSRLILRSLLPELDVRWRRPRPLRGRLHSTPHKLVDVLTHLALVTPRRFFQAIPAIHQ